MNNDLLNILTRVVENIGKVHPEYLRPDARVTPAFINDTLREWDKELGLMIAEVAIEDQDAKNILQELSKEDISSPLNVETIRLITSHYDKILFDQFIKEDADSECFEPWQYNNRANSRSFLGRPLEALEDYNRACEMDSECVLYRLNRAGTFVKLDMFQLALKDAIQVHAFTLGRTFGSTNDFIYLHDNIHLARILISCGRSDLAAESLLVFVDSIKNYLPFFSEFDDDSCVSMALDGHSSRLDIGIFLDEALELLRCVQINIQCNDCRTGALLAYLLTELDDLKLAIGCNFSNSEYQQRSIL